MTVVAFPSRRRSRVRTLEQRAALTLAALSEDLAELAFLLHSPDGSVRIGPMACGQRSGFEITAHIRRRRLRREHPDIVGDA
jgi:hypothetical protein